MSSSSVSGTSPRHTCPRSRRSDRSRASSASTRAPDRPPPSAGRRFSSTGSYATPFPIPPTSSSWRPRRGRTPRSSMPCGRATPWSASSSRNPRPKTAPPRSGCSPRGPGSGRSSTRGSRPRCCGRPGSTAQSEVAWGTSSRSRRGSAAPTPTNEDRRAASLVDSWLDSGINVLSVIGRFVVPAGVLSFRPLAGHVSTFEARLRLEPGDGTRVGSIVTTWQAAETTQSLRLRFADGSELLLDLMAGAATHLADGSVTEMFTRPEGGPHLAHQYANFYRDYFGSGEWQYPDAARSPTLHALLFSATEGVGVEAAAGRARPGPRPWGRPRCRLPSPTRARATAAPTPASAPSRPRGRPRRPRPRGGGGDGGDRGGPSGLSIPRPRG